MEGSGARHSRLRRHARNSHELPIPTGEHMHTHPCPATSLAALYSLGSTWRWLPAHVPAPCTPKSGNVAWLGQPPVVPLHGARLGYKPIDNASALALAVKPDAPVSLHMMPEALGVEARLPCYVYLLTGCPLGDVISTSAKPGLILFVLVLVRRILTGCSRGPKRGDTCANNHAFSCAGVTCFPAGCP